jgi:hypothetical protein
VGVRRRVHEMLMACVRWVCAPCVRCGVGVKREYEMLMEWREVR